MEPLGGDYKDLIDGISALVEETPDLSLISSATCRHNEKMAVYESKRGPQTIYQCLNLGLSASRIVRNKLILFISLPSKTDE